jgi:hypothetical protein
MRDWQPAPRRNRAQGIGNASFELNCTPQSDLTDERRAICGALPLLSKPGGLRRAESAPARSAWGRIGVARKASFHCESEIGVTALSGKPILPQAVEQSRLL